jgi:hypothetical protein
MENTLDFISSIFRARGESGSADERGEEMVDPSESSDGQKE